MSYVTLKADRTYNPITKKLEEQVAFSIFAENWKCINLHGVDNFLSVFKNRRTVAQSFWFDYFDENKPCVQKFVDDLKREMQKRGSSCKIRARKLQWNNNSEHRNVEPGVHFLRLLGCFDSKYLKSLDIVKSNFTSATINMLAKSEYWWFLKEIKMGINQPTMIDLFLTAERLKLSAQSFKESELRKIVESYRSRDLPRGSYFQLDAQKPWNLEEVLAGFPNVLSLENVGSKRFYTQKLQIGTGERVLIVKLSADTIEGVVCRSNFLEEDFAKHSL